MAEVKLMKGNEVLAEAAIRVDVMLIMVTLLPRNPKSWRLSCYANRGRKQEWSYCRPKVNWPLSTWYTVPLLAVKRQ